MKRAGASAATDATALTDHHPFAKKGAATAMKHVGRSRFSREAIFLSVAIFAVLVMPSAAKGWHSMARRNLDHIAQPIRSLARPIDKLFEDPANVRLHPEKNINAIKASLLRFNQQKPIVVDDKGVCVAGSGTLTAARALGWKHLAAVKSSLAGVDRSAFAIADNQTALLAEWDADALALQLGALRDEQFDLAAVGFDEAAAAALIEQQLRDGRTDPDDVPAPPDKAITKTGDVWILGTDKAGHRLMCGDSSRDADVDRLLAGATVHLVNTDPPYNVKVEPRSNNAIAAGQSAREMHNQRMLGALRGHHQKFDVARQGAKKATTKKLRAKDRPLMNDFISDEDFDRMLHAWFGQIGRVLKPGRGFYIWGGYGNFINYPIAIKASDLYFSQAIVWVKDHAVLTRKDFMGNHEWCFYGWREGAAHQFFGRPNVPDTWRLSRAKRGDVAIGRGVNIIADDGSRVAVLPPQGGLRDVQVGDAVTVHGMAECTDVWTVKKVSPQQMVHLTEKPVELATRAMQYSTREGETVLDLFGGSGSTLIGCEQTGRRACLMEMDPLYCDVIVNRWEKFTGKKARRAKA